ncbi:MAG TPA: carbonic anhydrase family protein, partial [Nitrospirota bacterium]|nr:carbonic anhydrase family protein [Nitrospirota bacterium]
MKKIMYMLHSLLLIAAVVMTVIPFAAATEKGAAGHEWSYEGEHGPQHWGDVKTDYAVCKTGKNQSPIDIIGAVKADLPPIQFAYKAAPLRIINNGHSIQV